MFKLDLPPKDERIFQLTKFQEEFLQHLLQYKYENIEDKRSLKDFPFMWSTSYIYPSEDIIKYDEDEFFFEDPYLIENSEKFEESLLINPIPTQKLVKILRKDLKGFTVNVVPIFTNRSIIVIGWD